ncbi:MAG: DedA [Microgenomates group bacterium GW2011_GWC1_38_12]|nr:MAG: DedA [Microgenomates group bacterium GW2011_GWC1_38_12]
METLVLIDKIENIYLSWGNILIFISSLIETSPMGFTIPGGFVVALGGFFSYGNKLNLAGVILSGTLGMLTTFLIAYVLGRKTGFSLAKKFHQQKYFELAKRLLENHGPIILTTSLLANITRFWIAYVAGSQKYRFFKFMFYATAASLTWNSLLVTVGYLAGSERGQLESGLAKLGILSWGILLLTLGIIYIKTKKEFLEIKKGK